MEGWDCSGWEGVEEGGCCSSCCSEDEVVVLVEAARMEEVERMLLVLGPAYRRSESEDGRKGIVARRRVLGCIVEVVVEIEIG